VLKELMAIGGELRKGARTIKEIVQFNDEELNHQNVAPARPEHGSAHAGYSNPQVIAIMQSSTGTSGETASFTIRRRCIGWRIGGIYAISAEQHRHGIPMHSSSRTGVRKAASRVVDTALVSVDGHHWF